jgi:hypothetical protein
MCECIRLVNESIAEHNSKLCLALYLSSKPPRVLISTERLDTSKRGKSISLTSSFCPFCGKNYDEEEKVKNVTE